MPARITGILEKRVETGAEAALCQQKWHSGAGAGRDHIGSFRNSERPKLSAGVPPRRSRERMMVLDQTAQTLFENMRVDLRRRNVRVTEHLLHGTQVGAVRKQMTGECMAQHVG